MRHRHPGLRGVRRPHPTFPLWLELSKLWHLLVRVGRNPQDGARIDPSGARLHHFLQLPRSALIDRAYAAVATVEREVHHEVALRVLDVRYHWDDPDVVGVGLRGAEHLQELVALRDDALCGPQRLRAGVVVAVDEAHALEREGSRRGAVGLEDGGNDVEDDGARRVQHEVGAAVAIDEYGGEDEEAKLVSDGPGRRGPGELAQRHVAEACVDGRDLFGGTRLAYDPVDWRRGQKDWDPTTANSATGCVDSLVYWPSGGLAFLAAVP